MPIINMVYKKKKGWKPWANTLLYLPMTEDFNDHSQNHFTLTNSWVALEQNQANIPVWNFNGSAYLSWANSSLFNFGDFHLGVWVKLSQIKQSQFIFAGIGSWNIFFWYRTYSGDKIGIWRNTVARDSTAQYSLNTGWWYYISYDRNWTNLSISVNSNVIGTLTNNISYNTSWWYQIGNDGYWYNIYWYMSELILESKARTAQEILDYYNQTKSNYWL